MALKTQYIQPGRYSNGSKSREVLQVRGVVRFSAEVVYRDEQGVVHVCGLTSFARWATHREN